MFKPCGNSCGLICKLIKQRQNIPVLSIKGLTVVLTASQPVITIVKKCIHTIKTVRTIEDFEITEEGNDCGNQLW